MIYPETKLQNCYRTIVSHRKRHFCVIICLLFLHNCKVERKLGCVTFCQSFLVHRGLDDNHLRFALLLYNVLLLLRCRWRTVGRVHDVSLANAVGPPVNLSASTHAAGRCVSLAVSNAVLGLDGCIQLRAWWSLHSWTYRLAHCGCHAHAWSCHAHRFSFFPSSFGFR